MKTRTLASFALTLAALLALPSAHAALIPNGGGDNGWTNNGWTNNGWGQNGWGTNGKSAMGTRSNQTPAAIKVQSIQLPSGEVVTLR